ncbi:1437_t:CDS:2, partial [Rhizophagus irregularis]
MTEITPTITPSTNSNDNNTTTTTIIPPNIPPDNINNSEYQRSYSWKLPMVKVNRPKERTKSEYQQLSCNTPEPIKSTMIATSTATTVNNNIDFIGSKLNDLNITTTSNTINNNISIINNNFIPDDYVFNTNNNVPDKWRDGLRSKNSPEQKQSLASNLDPKTKKMVALEANRLSKKSRSYSMYSLHDQLKVHEIADDLSSPYDTEYNKEFVNWKEYGSVVREDINKKRHSNTDNNHTLKRRDLGSRANTREKLQPTITDSKSIRGITTTITAKSHSRLSRDNYYDEKRPTTSAEVRDYRKDRNTSPLRSSTTLDNYKDINVTSKYYDTREYNNNSSGRRDYDVRRDYDGKKDYDYYDDHKYDDRRREDIYDDHHHKRENGYDDRRRDLVNDDRRRDNVHDDRQRDISTYDYDYHYDSKYNNNRTVHNSDHEHFIPGHSRNTSYASYASSSNKGSSVHDEPINYSGPPLSYLDAMRHRSSVSSLSSVSTPSSPATPIGYDLNDMRWKRNNGLDPRIYKEQNYSPSVISKSSSGSNHKYWQFEDDKDKYYQPSALSPSRSKFYIDDEEEDDEHIEGYSSKRQSRDYKPSSMRYSSQYSPTRSTSPSRDSYGSGRKYKSSRPPSRATSVSSHATSIEEESAVLTDLLKEAEIMTLKNLTDQMSIFKTRDLGIGTGIGIKGVKGVKNSGRATPAASGRATPSVSGRATPAVSGRATPSVSGRATPAVSGRATPSVNGAKRSSLGAQKKPTTTTTVTTRAAGIKTKTTPTIRTSTKPGATTTTRGTKNSSTPGIPPNKKKTHRPASSLSSISSTSSYREAYQPPPPPTNFSAARDALNRARMKVEEMLEI